MKALLPIGRIRMVRKTSTPNIKIEKCTEDSLAGNFSTRVESGTEDWLFERFRTDDNSLMSVGKFLDGLALEGLKRTDPRLAGVMKKLTKFYELSGREGKSPSTQKLTKEEFKEAIAPNLPLISRAFSHTLIIPRFNKFTSYIEQFYWKCKSNVEGKVADYIPQLARVNPNYWAVSVCTIDGQRFSIGDINVPFTLQSVSKPLTYGIALDRLSQDVVHEYIGQEPSGRNFNELILDYNKKPHNPMINAGAIVVCSLLRSLVHPEMTLAEKFEFTKDIFQRMAGGEYIGFNNAIFLSERAAADRNYALGFYMREHKCFPERSNLREVMDFYFQCCSMEATCESVAVMSATLANGGICPLTEDQVLKPEATRDVLSLMHSCGMYDYSGQFAFKVGLPAKSGVSGVMMIVIPNVLGICSWSPALDQLGNSVRGVQFCESAITKLTILNSHQAVSENIIRLLTQNPHMSQPELAREYKAQNFNDLENNSNSQQNESPFYNRSRRHNYPQGVSLVNLMFSAANGDIAALRMHWLSGMDMSLPDYDGRTALHLASAEGHLESVKFLLEQCKVPHDTRDRWGNTPLNEAKTFQRVQIVEYMTKFAAQGKSSKLKGNSPKEKPEPPSAPKKEKPK